MFASLSSPPIRGALLLLGLLLVGCGREPSPPVAPGRYRAYLEGGITDTLTGPAVFRRRDHKLVGLELGRPKGPGLSIELGPRPLHLRAYNVVAARLLRKARPKGPSGLVAFLSVGGTRLEAIRGSLSVTYVEEGEVGGTFEFVMRGFAGNSPDELSVRVKGALWATTD